MAVEEHTVEMVGESLSACMYVHGYRERVTSVRHHIYIPVIECRSTRPLAQAGIGKASHRNLHAHSVVTIRMQCLLE